MAVIVKGDDKCIIVATFYGFSGANSDQVLFCDNERLIAAAILRMASFRGAPYHIMGDFSVIIHNSDFYDRAAASKIVIDLPKAFTPSEKDT